MRRRSSTRLKKSPMLRAGLSHRSKPPRLHAIAKSKLKRRASAQEPATPEPKRQGQAIKRGLGPWLPNGSLHVSLAREIWRLAPENGGPFHESSDDGDRKSVV